MPEISNAKFRQMEKRYDPRLAEFLAVTAKQGAVLTYTDLGQAFVRPARGWGDELGGVAIECQKRGWPILPVIVVTKRTGMPSDGAALYRDMGFETTEKLRAEQQRCFTFDWEGVSWRAPSN
jgi:hypothetical protein